jgi:ATPase subunit of ABC transporter with duplicated ATPase domains
MISFQQTPLSIDGEALFTIPKFTLQDQDKVGLIAANGRGKTTFLRAVAEKKLPHNASIAFCPQKTPLDWLDRTWNDLVVEAAGVFNFQQFYDLTDKFQVAVDRPLRTLSGGQQRLGLICFVLQSTFETYTQIKYGFYLLVMQQSYFLYFLKRNH